MQNFLLPLLIGTDEFGLLAYMLASSALLYSLYDNGYNLLVMRKNKFQHVFMRCKIELFFLASIGYVLLWALNKNSDMISPFLVLPHAFLMIWYSYFNYTLLASRRMKQVAKLALVISAFSFFLPLLISKAGLPVIYAPLIAVGASLGLALLIFPELCLTLLVRDVFTAWRLDLHGVGYRWALFLKQAQISVGAILNSLIVWAGVYIVAMTQGFHEAAAFRLTMSLLALMTLTIPFFKPSFLRLAQKSGDFIKLALVSSQIILLSGFAQLVIVYLVAETVLNWVFPDLAATIFALLMPLSLLPALSVMLELETVLLDRFNKLKTLLATCALSIMLVAPWALFFRSIALITVFYSVFCAANLAILIQSRKNVR